MSKLKDMKKEKKKEEKENKVKTIYIDLSNEYTTFHNATIAPVLAIINENAKLFAYLTMKKTGNLPTYGIQAYERFYMDIIAAILDFVREERWKFLKEIMAKVKPENPDEVRELLKKLGIGEENIKEEGGEDEIIDAEEHASKQEKGRNNFIMYM